MPEGSEDRVVQCKFSACYRHCESRISEWRRPHRAQAAKATRGGHRAVRTTALRTAGKNQAAQRGVRASARLTEQRIPFAGRLRRPHPQATGNGFGAETASTHAQHRGAAPGPNSRGKGVESVRSRRPPNVGGKASPNSSGTRNERVLAGGPADPVRHHLGGGRRPRYRRAHIGGAAGRRELPGKLSSATNNRSTHTDFFGTVR